MLTVYYKTPARVERERYYDLLDNCNAGQEQVKLTLEGIIGPNKVHTAAVAKNINGASFELDDLYRMASNTQLLEACQELGCLPKSE